MDENKEIIDCTPTFLVPEIVQKSRAAANLKKNAEKVTSQVENVYQSKQRNIEKISVVINSLVEDCSTCEQKEKSFIKKQGGAVNQFFHTMTKGGKLKQSNIVENQALLEAFDTCVKAMDQMSNASEAPFQTFETNNVLIMVEEANLEMTVLNDKCDEIRDIVTEPNNSLKLVRARVIPTQNELLCQTEKIASLADEENLVMKEIAELELLLHSES